MQQQDVAGGQRVSQAPQQDAGVAADRIPAAPGPGHVAQAGWVEGGVQQRAAQPSRRPEISRRCAGGVADGRLRVEDFAAHGTARPAGEAERVAVGVVFHAMAAPQDVLAERGVACGAVANQEEAGGGVVRGQEVEHARRDVGVGAVVEGQHDLVPADRGEGQAGDVGAEQGTAGPEAEQAQDRMVGKQAGGDPGPGRWHRGQGDHTSGVKP